MRSNRGIGEFSMNYVRNTCTTQHRSVIIRLVMYHTVACTMSYSQDTNITIDSKYLELSPTPAPRPPILHHTKSWVKKEKENFDKSTCFWDYLRCWCTIAIILGGIALFIFLMVTNKTFRTIVMATNFY